MISPSLGTILEEYTHNNNRIGVVEFDGKRRPIYLSLVPDAHVGDCVRFHAGFATERVEAVENENPPNEYFSTGFDVETVQAYKVLSELDPKQLEKLLPLAEDKQFAAGQIIFRAGEKSMSLHLIVSGDVALEGDQGTLVYTLHGGDAMGWSALTTGARTHFRARALSDVSTIAFPGEQLREACNRDPALGYALMKSLLELASERLDLVRLKMAQPSYATAAGTR